MTKPKQQANAEKPISLRPLDVKQAIHGLSKVKPPVEEADGRKRRAHKKTGSEASPAKPVEDKG